MKVLIIGSSGFIGSHLYQYLSLKGYQVRGCDISKVQVKEDSFILLSSGNEDFSGVFENEVYDLCINASGSASVPFSITNPADDFRLNVTNVYLLLHKILKFQPSCRFINFSSAAVYGNPDSLPVSEEMPSSPLSPYGFHKMLSEHICNEFYKLYKIETLSLRVFSAFGPRLHKQLFWDLAAKADNSQIVELFGTGNESRDFIYIDDLVAAVEKVIHGSQFNGDVINVSSGEETSVSYAAETFLGFYKPDAVLKFSGIEKPGDRVNWKADISKLKAMGFTGSVTFEDGVRRYSDWLKINSR
jgi:UDP-glucose 4-epimerase